MEQDIIFLAPAFQERIWGGTKIRSMYGYDIPNEQTGDHFIVPASIDTFSLNGTCELIVASE